MNYTLVDELVEALTALLSEYRNADNSKAENMALAALKRAANSRLEKECE